MKSNSIGLKLAVFAGRTGPDLFKTAVDALRNVCRENQIPLAS